MQIGTHKNGGSRNYKLADYLYSIVIQVNSFHNNKADKQFGNGVLNGGGLRNIHCICNLLADQS